MNKRLLDYENLGCNENGQIFDAQNKEYLEISISPKGYPCVMIDGGWKNARILIWEAFNGKLAKNERVTVKKGCAKDDLKITSLEKFTVQPELKPEDFYNVLCEIRDLLKVREKPKTTTAHIDDTLFEL